MLVSSNIVYPIKADQLQQPIAFDAAETKRILRKVDFRLIPILTTLYIFSFLDRSAYKGITRRIA